KECGECEVGIGVGARYSRLGPEVLSMADDAEPACPVVVAPGQGGRRPAAGGEALVRVDVRRQEDRQLRHVRDVPRKVRAEGRRLPVERVASTLPETRMHAARARYPAAL